MLSGDHLQAHSSLGSFSYNPVAQLQPFRSLATGAMHSRASTTAPGKNKAPEALATMSLNVEQQTANRFPFLQPPAELREMVYRLIASKDFPTLYQCIAYHEQSQPSSMSSRFCCLTTLRPPRSQLASRWSPSRPQQRS